MGDLINLPTDILMEIIIKLTFYQMIQMCYQHPIFVKICDTDILWKLMITEKFPSYVSDKPVNVSWKEYGKNLYKTKVIPIYYQGNRLGYISFDPLRICQAIHDASKYFCKPNLDLVFVNHHFYPVAVNYYPDSKIIHNDKTDVSILVIMDKYIKNNMYPYKQIITELTSHLGTPPIYIYHQTQKVVTHFNDYINSSKHHISIPNYIKFFWELNIPYPIGITIPDIYRINDLCEYHDDFLNLSYWIDSGTVPDDRLRYAYVWYTWCSLQNNINQSLFNQLEFKLYSIGHVL